MHLQAFERDSSILERAFVIFSKCLCVAARPEHILYGFTIYPNLETKESEMKKREEVWWEVKHLPVDKMDSPLPFYPDTKCAVLSVYYHGHMSIFNEVTIN